MAGEVNVQAALSVRKSTDSGIPLIDYQGRPGTFRGDMDGSIGPTPGALVVTTAGVDISLSVISGAGLDPGYGFVANYDTTNYIKVGISDGSRFFSMLEVGPGEQYVYKLDRELGWTYSSTTGTGTIPGGGGTYKLHAKAF